VFHRDPPALPSSTDRVAGRDLHAVLSVSTTVTAPAVLDLRRLERSGGPQESWEKMGE
jgi:hypothetical protein